MVKHRSYTQRRQRDGSIFRDHVHKYGADINTAVTIPARHLRMLTAAVGRTQTVPLYDPIRDLWNPVRAR